MTTSNVNALPHRLADLMEAAGAKGGPAEVRELAAKLAPFGTLSLTEFAGFLAKAEAYSRGELESVFPKAKEKKAKAVKAADPNRVGTTIATLRTLYERALDPSVTEQSVADALKGVEKLSLAEIGEVTAACGFEQKFRTKKPALDALRKWILGRKGTFDRAGA